MRDPEFHEFDRDLHDPSAYAFVPPKPDIWQRLSRVMEVMLYLLALAAIMRLFAPEVEKQRKLNAELAQVELLQAERLAEVNSLKQEYDLLKNDAAYVDLMARDRLNKALDGEYIVRIERETDPDESTPVTEERRPVIRPLVNP